MFRPQVLLVRLVIFGLILLALWLSAPGWLQPLVRHALQRSFGTAIDFDQCQLDWSRSGIQLANVQIADPQDPLRNLVQASSVWLEFSPSSIWTRQLEITKARWNEVVLGSPREKLAGDRLNGASQSWLRTRAEHLNYDLNLAAKRWLDRVQALPPVDRGVSATQFAAVSKEIRATWEREFARQRHQTESVHAEIANLKQELNRAGVNPLRVAEEEKARLARLTELESQLESVRQWLANWPALEQEALSKLAQSRSQTPSPTLASHSFASATLPASEALLVSELDLDTTQQLVDWSLALSHRLQDLKAASSPLPHRGSTRAIRGVTPKPSLTIAETEFSGAFHSASGHVDFTGTTRNVSDHPELSGQPVEFHVKGQGPKSFQIDGQLDYSSGELVETMKIQLLPGDAPSSQIGTASSVLLVASPHRMQAEACLVIKGEQLEGEIVCFHSQLGLYVNALNEIAGGQNVLEKLNRQLATIQNIEVVATISGTVRRPEIKFVSSLAETFTPALTNCLEESNQQQASYNQALIEQTYETVLESLSSFAAAESKKLQDQLDSEQTRLGELDRQLPFNRLRNYR